jgi:hypothetical protein
MVYEDASSVPPPLRLLLLPKTNPKLYAKVFATGQKLLNQAMNAIGIKEHPAKEKGFQQVGINTLPWPRAEIVSFPKESGTGAQGTGGGSQLAIVQADAFSVEGVESPGVQLQMIGGGATSTAPHFPPVFPFPPHISVHYPCFFFLLTSSFFKLIVSHREGRWNLYPRKW